MAVPFHVSLLALPEVAASTLFGIFDVLNACALVESCVQAGGSDPPFHVEIVGAEAGALIVNNGVPVNVHRAISTIGATNILVVPSVMFSSEGWKKGRYPELIRWTREMHARGAVLCSACTGLFFLAETGLFDGKDTTVYYGLSQEFARTFPDVRIHPEQVLMISGAREELVTSGASMTWHDMVLYLIARFTGSTTAQEVARMFALQWHQDGLAPYMIFEGRTDHGDSEIRTAQKWLASNFAVANPVEEMIRASSLSERTFKRRFVSATGLTPIGYVQRLRVEDAKRRLERTSDSVDEISWRAGYEDAAFFRRLFKRTTGLSPGVYRKRFQVPEFARTKSALAEKV